MPANGVVPTAQELAPWVAAIERLWDDPDVEAEHRRRSVVEAKPWDRDKLAELYEAFFDAICACGERGAGRFCGLRKD